MQELVEAAVRDFNQTLGVKDMPMPESGPLQYSFEQGGIFYIEPCDEGVLFYLTRELPDFGIEDASEKALILCHPNQSQKFDTQCALMDSNILFFLLFMTSEKLDGPQIESILQYLMKLHDTVSSS